MPRARTFWDCSLVWLILEKIILAAVIPELILLVTNPMGFNTGQRVSASVAVLAIGCFVAFTIENHTAASPASKESIQSPESSRVFLPEDVDSEYLTNIYVKNTSIQAGSLAANYIGRWMKISGQVEGVRDIPSTGEVLVGVSVRSRNDKKIQLAELVFERKRWRDILAAVRLESSIKAVGKLSSISVDGPTLEQCELLQPNGVQPN